MEIERHRFARDSESQAASQSAASVSPFRQLAGQLIGEYVMERPLGIGAFGEVWLAHHHVWRKHSVAIKIPTNPELLKSLRNEGVVQTDLMQLKSENLVSLLGMSVAHEPPYLVMEFVDGMSLREKLQAQESPLPVGEAIRILEGALNGLAEAHNAGVVHRDIKPENILLTRNGIPKLSDFSVAFKSPDSASLQMSLETESAGIRSLAGTLMYMAPEQRRGDFVDERADVYAMGLLLFEMLTGELPQPGDRLQDFRDDVPPAIEELFARCFARAERRFANAGEMLAALRQPPQKTRPEPESKHEIQRNASSKRRQTDGTTALSTRDLQKLSHGENENSRIRKDSTSSPVLSTRSLESTGKTMIDSEEAKPSDRLKAKRTDVDREDRFERTRAKSEGVAPSSGSDRFTRPKPRPVKTRNPGVSRPADLTDVMALINEMPEDEALDETQRAQIQASPSVDASHPGTPASAEPPPLRALYRDEPAARGASLYAAGNYTAAADAFDKAKRDNPKDFASTKGLAMSFFKMGKPKKALNLYREALVLQPEAASVWNNIAVVLMALKRYREAERALLRAIDLKPRYVPAHSNLSAVYKALGRSDDAEAAAQRALEIDPDNFEAAYNAGL